MLKQLQGANALDWSRTALDHASRPAKTGVSRRGLAGFCERLMIHTYGDRQFIEILSAVPGAELGAVSIGVQKGPRISVQKGL
ncbi:hypothetical protein [Methylorubrum aminovorans]